MKSRTPLLLVGALVLLFVILKQVERRSERDVNNLPPPAAPVLPPVPATGPAPGPQSTQGTLSTVPLPIPAPPAPSPFQQRAPAPAQEEAPTRRLSPLPATVPPERVKGLIGEAFKFAADLGPLPSLESVRKDCKENLSIDRVLDAPFHSGDAAPNRVLGLTRNLCQGDMSKCSPGSPASKARQCGQSEYLEVIKSAAENLPDHDACRLLIMTIRLPLPPTPASCFGLIDAIQRGDASFCGNISGGKGMTRDECVGLFSVARGASACSRLSDRMTRFMCQNGSALYAAAKDKRSSACGESEPCRAAMKDPSVCSDANMRRLADAELSRFCSDDIDAVYQAAVAPHADAASQVLARLDALDLVMRDEMGGQKGDELAKYIDAQAEILSARNKIRDFEKKMRDAVEKSNRMAGPKLEDPISALPKP